MASTTTRVPKRWLLCAALAAAAFAIACPLIAALPSAPASAQAWVGVPPASAVPAASTRLTRGGGADPNAQMLVQADELHYDDSGERVSAVGKVQIHYLGSVLEADRVVYHQKDKRLHAEGRVRLTEADGKIINADRLDLDENFRNGFVDSLHLETVDRIRLAAVRAERSEGQMTVFQSSVYTACEPCKDDPHVPPKWQVKAARILHDEAEKTIYFQDARFELFGFPIAYFPYFWAPDPTVKKKTGLLQPRFMYGKYFGYGVQVPVFWNLAPDYDVTFAPIMTTNQGPLMVTEWRQRLVNGAYTIRGAGIFQQDPSAFVGTTGERDFRGAIETWGNFRLAERWWWGWDASAFTDNSFPSQYRATRQGNEVLSQAYLFGRGKSSYFDARALHIYGLSPLDIQKQLPILHPLVDYKYKFEYPVLGGELTYNVNVASLSRQQADFDPITRAAAASGVCDNVSPMVIKTRAECLLRGIPGTYSRLSSEVQWRRTFVDSYGQIFTPFLWARGDAAALSISSSDPSVGNFIQPGESSIGRVTPAIGLDYRYPFISAHAWGTQTIEPRVQLIARPNETQIGKLPNEDSQSLLYDDVNLFNISKYPGWDRVEGGTRANVGLQYTAQFNQGGYVNALFGQSYHLFGRNSYAVGDMANTGVESGLETERADYVARATIQPNSTYSFTSRFRFDEQDLTTRRMEVEGKVNFDRWTTSLTYGRYDSQPLVGLLLPREGILPAATFKITPNWSVNAGALYSIDSSRLATASFGVGYIDECIAINAIYSSTHGYRGDIVPNQVFMLQINFRTLGGTAFSQVVGGPGGGDSTFGF